ncbi:hypothetical protein CG007_02405 [Mesoplasma entomophilum]|uniref:lipoprotein n=1 Tax=Mesoplasma entomophilum TaxID=2149 RepID=UPI000D0390E4|nr:lipoprotein [Mesoplasma entomophilum]AVN60455.1 hypothetical protein CG007_02405 [Mesoplasma entomophilum]
MKKLLSILGAVGITATGASLVVSCGNKTVEDTTIDLSTIELSLKATNKTTDAEVMKAVNSVKGLEKAIQNTDILITREDATTAKEGKIVITGIKGSTIVKAETSKIIVIEKEAGQVTPPTPEDTTVDLSKVELNLNATNDTTAADVLKALQGVKGLEKLDAKEVEITIDKSTYDVVEKTVNDTKINVIENEKAGSITIKGLDSKLVKKDSIKKISVASPVTDLSKVELNLNATNLTTQEEVIAALKEAKINSDSVEISKNIASVYNAGKIEIKANELKTGTNLSDAVVNGTKTLTIGEVSSNSKKVSRAAIKDALRSDEMILRGNFDSREDFLNYLNNKSKIGQIEGIENITLLDGKDVVKKTNAGDEHDKTIFKMSFQLHFNLKEGYAFDTPSFNEQAKSRAITVDHIFTGENTADSIEIYVHMLPVAEISEVTTQEITTAILEQSVAVEHKQVAPWTVAPNETDLTKIVKDTNVEIWTADLQGEDAATKILAEVAEHNKGLDAKKAEIKIEEDAAKKTYKLVPKSATKDGAETAYTGSVTINVTEIKKAPKFLGENVSTIEDAQKILDSTKVIRTIDSKDINVIESLTITGMAKDDVKDANADGKGFNNTVGYKDSKNDVMIKVKLKDGYTLTEAAKEEPTTPPTEQQKETGEGSEKPGTVIPTNEFRLEKAIKQVSELSDVFKDADLTYDLVSGDTTASLQTKFKELVNNQFIAAAENSKLNDYTKDSNKFVVTPLNASGTEATKITDVVKVRVSMNEDATESKGSIEFKIYQPGVRADLSVLIPNTTELKLESNQNADATTVKAALKALNKDLNTDKINVEITKTAASTTAKITSADKEVYKGETTVTVKIKAPVVLTLGQFDAQPNNSDIISKFNDLNPDYTVPTTAAVTINGTSATIKDGDKVYTVSFTVKKIDLSTDITVTEIKVETGKTADKTAILAAVKAANSNLNEGEVEIIIDNGTVTVKVKDGSTKYNAGGSVVITVAEKSASGGGSTGGEGTGSSFAFNLSNKYFN